MSINATVFGRLTRDPEVKTSQGGSTYVNFSVAVNHGKDLQTGQDKVTFVELTAYGKTGEIVAQKLRKSARVLVSAELELNKWTAQNGATGATLRGNVRSVDIIDWPENAQQTTAPAPGGYGVQPQYGAPPVQGGYQAPPQQAPMPGYGAPPAYGQPPVQQPLQYQQPPTQQQAPVQQGYGQPAPTAQPGPGNTPW